MKKLWKQHRVEHGFDKMQDGGVNRNFGGDTMSGHSNMVVAWGGMDRGYRYAPGMGVLPATILQCLAF